MKMKFKKYGVEMNVRAKIVGSNQIVLEYNKPCEKYCTPRCVSETKKIMTSWLEEVVKMIDKNLKGVMEDLNSIRDSKTKCTLEYSKEEKRFLNL